MLILVSVSRAIVLLVGSMALILAGTSLAPGGGSITDPVMPFGLLFRPAHDRRCAVDHGSRPMASRDRVARLLAIVAAFVTFVVSIGDAAIRDVIVYLGIPATIVLVATATLAVARSRAGPLGSAAE